jgi:hypothetical protein
MFRSWFDRLKPLFGGERRGHGRKARPRQRRRCTLQLEVLEDRCLLSTTAAGSALQAFGQLPLSFEANQGQTAAKVDFLSRGNGYSLFLSAGEAVLGLQKQSAVSDQPSANAGTSVLRMDVVGANRAVHGVALDPLPGTSNYFLGNDPSKWHTNIPNYGQVEYKDIYEGIDLLYHGNQQQLEYDFQVAPGADASAIRLAFHGVRAVTIDAQGNLVLHTPGGDVVEQAPVLYQEIDGVRHAVSGHYVLEGHDRVGFAVGPYDHSHSLTIDPVLSYSSYLGTADNIGFVGGHRGGIARDAAGNIYIEGTGSLGNLTAQHVYQYPANGTQHVFVAELNPTGTALLYIAYLGGSGRDFGGGIAVDANGAAYVTGTTNSTDFPTKNALQSSLAGGSDAFVTKLNPGGSSLAYSTYLGGSGNEGNQGQISVAVDANGDAYVTGNTNSTNFPTKNPMQATLAGGTDVFVSELNPSGSGLVYSTYLGGSGNEQVEGIAVNGSGNAYLVGNTTSKNFPTANPLQASLAGRTNGFVTELNAAGSGFVYSTYLGGSGYDSVDAIALDAAGNTYVAGSTSSKNFPTTSNAFQVTNNAHLYDGFVAKLNASGTSLLYSTFLGGSQDNHVEAIALDPAGNAYLTGATASTDFPLKNPVQATYGGGGSSFTPWGDAFVTELNAAGSGLVYSTYLGGSKDDEGSAIVVDSTGNAYVAGNTFSTNFPTVTPLQGTLNGSEDVFLARINAAP